MSDYDTSIKLVLDSTEVIEKRNDLLLLKVKDTEESKINLLRTGFLSPNLKYIRWYFKKSSNNSKFGTNLFSLIYEDSEVHFQSGDDGDTLVSAQLKEAKRLIKELVKSLNLAQNLFL